jgi:hypothetical protein
LEEEHHFQACLTRDLMPYQEEAVRLRAERDEHIRMHLDADNARYKAEAERDALRTSDDMFYIRQRNEARAERDELTTIVRNLCLGHDDECVCPGCRAVFRRDAALREGGK